MLKMPFIKWLAIFSMGRGFEHLKELFRCYAARIYMDVTDIVRKSQVLLLVSVGCLIIFISGFLMLNIALLLSLSWTLESKVILLASLGAFYLIAPIVVLCFLHSKEKWLKITGLKKLLDDCMKE